MRGMTPTPPQEGNTEGQEPTPSITAAVRLYLEARHRAHGPDDDQGDDDQGDDDDTGAGDDPGDDDDDDDEGEPLDPKVAKAELARARQDAAKYRRQLRDLERAAEEEKRKGLPELERLQGDLQTATERAEKAEKALLQRELADKVSTAAQALGFRNPAKALRHIDHDGLVDDEGAVDQAEVTKRLRAALKEEPYLGGATGGGDGGAGRKDRGTGSPSVNDTIRALARGKRAAG